MSSDRWLVRLDEMAERNEPYSPADALAPPGSIHPAVLRTNLVNDGLTDDEALAAIDRAVSAGRLIVVRDGYLRAARSDANKPPRTRAPIWKRLVVRETLSGSAAVLDGEVFALSGADDAEFLRELIAARGGPLAGTHFHRPDRIMRRLPPGIRGHVRGPGGRGRRTGYLLID